jgi:phosphodiesterase/alkaline phosphatase D-like protein
VDDYRARHASHRKDEGLQLLTRSAPTLAMWGALRLLELFHAPVYH